MMIAWPYTALNLLVVEDVQCNTSSSWQCTDTIPPWFWWSRDAFPFEMKYCQTCLVVFSSRCNAALFPSSKICPLSQRPVQENSGVNCDNRDEIIVVAATGREKHGVQQRQCWLLPYCNLVFYNSCRIGVIVWRDAFKLAHSGRVKAVLLRRSPGSRAICEQHWSSWIHSLLSQLNRTIIGLAADLNRPEITEELVWHGRNLSDSITSPDSQTQFHFWNLDH